MPAMRPHQVVLDGGLRIPEEEFEACRFRKVKGYAPAKRYSRELWLTLISGKNTLHRKTRRLINRPGRRIKSRVIVYLIHVCGEAGNELVQQIGADGLSQMKDRRFCGAGPLGLDCTEICRRPERRDVVGIEGILRITEKR